MVAREGENFLMAPTRLRGNPVWRCSVPDGEQEPLVFAQPRGGATREFAGLARCRQPVPARGGLSLRVESALAVTPSSGCFGYLRWRSTSLNQPGWCRRAQARLTLPVSIASTEPLIQMAA